MNHAKIGHRRWFGLVGAVATLAIVGLTPGAALAVVPSGVDQPVVKGPNFSYGEASWDQATDNLSSLEAHPGAAFASNYCLATIFDWKTADGEHFDARIAKTCKSSIHIDVSSNDAVQNGDPADHRWLTGMVKFGACYGPSVNTNTTASNCNDFWSADRTVWRDQGQWPTDDAVGPNANVPNQCARSWRVDVGGTSVLYNNGGLSNSCAS
ncbi:hypothetical protein [Actinoplanes sp. NPDC051494]|uniref:hypothetical protein n=1 Tax=Actinoplanes sp. NPDC051494 TaxID=3363907 RepID=UPI00379793CE